ncbi:hypothetical protein DFA_11807 [Cavenderia fasciculata]|uniref:Protein transport protein SEC24 n=1 Tax=Cavenderia fasciculata TaxID=261658 RepID=F4QE97_CACFS|nr:uncharacterized protein DFA_11807 [Cavenderia fasciculata]EGG14044.1 hypothetical protein DFA_11807 [Cavenderia fasciculata]|eukprot:XP_004350752.1 hypothetical protein DFA_11807 [Cavenderia fasciculata]
MNVKFSTQRFPHNPSIKDASGTIWGCVVQPFRNNYRCNENAKNIDRCKKCLGYINPFVTFEKSTWICNLCKHANHISDDDNEDTSFKYADVDQRNIYPELTNSNLVLQVDQEDDDEDQDNLSDSIYNNNPTYIALVDISGNNEQMEVIKSGLEALVHALPDNSLFGMIVYSYKIGIFNLNCSSPSIKYLDAISSFNNDISLNDILPISGFLVNKSKHESNIMSAISILSDIDSTINRKKGGSIRALGPTISLLLNYLQSSNLSLHVKIGIFMAGKPSVGEGSIDKEYNTVDSMYSSFSSKDFLKPSSNTYKLLAEKAIQVGSHFDIYAIGSTYFGFDTIKYLCTITGGNLYRYTNITSTCPLPQDIYKLVSNGWGFHGLLRIRTSRNYSVDSCFGNLLQSKTYKDLYHIESCSTFTSIAFDFKFTDPSAFEGGENQPFIQIAFSYTYLPPVVESSTDLYSSSPSLMVQDSADRVKSNFRTLERRLHVFTAPIHVADSPVDLFNNIDLETTICLLTHKIIKESLEKGIKESRLLLLGWLSNFITRYNENVVILSSVKSSVDLSFGQTPHLKPLPRYVFALLKGKLLKTIHKSMEEDVLEKRSDDWIYTQVVYSSLDQKMLHRAIYPVLSTYGAPNNLASKYLTLSTTTITSNISHIYLLDAYDTLMVYYAPQAVSNMYMFPPPPDSLIRQTISNSKQDRLIVPSVEYTKGPLEQVGQFRQYLVEDENTDGNSYIQFINSVEEGLKKLLSSTLH